MYTATCRYTQLPQLLSSHWKLISGPLHFHHRYSCNIIQTYKRLRTVYTYSLVSLRLPKSLQGKLLGLLEWYFLTANCVKIFTAKVHYSKI